MAIKLAQIPGFADVADSNFAAEQFAIGLNFQRTIDNAKFGVVRPEVFVGKYINGDTVTLPTSVVDGYTYSREELSYMWNWGLSGGTATGNNGAPSQPGAIRYMAALVDQVSGAVSTQVEYLVGDGRGPTVTNDGTLEVFTIATRRLTSLVVAAPPAYVAVSDNEAYTDAPVTDSLMQRINRNAKFAALRCEVIYMGEFVDGDTIPQPVSPADGYEYSYAECFWQGSWRWTTQGDQLVDPTDPNFKQIQDMDFSITPNGGVSTFVSYYQSGFYNSNNGRIVVLAFCQRAVQLGAGVVDFVDLSADFWASGRPEREDVMARQIENIRYSLCRREFFQAGYANGQTVALPVSPLDGYQYSRDELTYVYSYNTSPVSFHAPRMQQWSTAVDQATGLVSVSLVRVAQGGGLVPTNDGGLLVMTVARRDHAGNDSLDYPFTINGSGGADITALQDGGFDSWNKPTDQTASAWSINQQNGAGYGAQAPGLVSGFAQRLGVSASSTAQPPITTGLTIAQTPHYISILSSSVSTRQGALYYTSWVQQPSVANIQGLTLTVRLFDAIGDSAFFVLFSDTQAIPAGITQTSVWFQMPFKGDAAVATNSVSASGGTVPLTTNNGAALLDFVPSTLRLEFYFNGSLQSYIDLDEVTLLNQTDPSAGQVAQRGSTSLAFFPALSWTVTDTEFTPNPIPPITRADGTVTTVQGVPPTITGLTPATSYVWYPYLNESTKQLQSVLGDSGSPAWLQSVASQAFYQAWYSLQNLPLALMPVIITTQATPTGGGTAPPSGGTGGGGTGSGGYGGGTGRPSGPIQPIQPNGPVEQ